MTFRTFLFHKYQDTISQNPPNNINLSMSQQKWPSYSQIIFCILDSQSAIRLQNEFRL